MSKDEPKSDQGQTVVPAPEQQTDKKTAVAKAKSKKRSGKDFVELLTEDLSWQTIRDVMTYDLNRPLREKTTGDLADVALKRGWITKEQHNDLRESKGDVADSIGHSMVEREVITSEQLAEAREVMQRTGQPLWRTLLQLKMMLPEDVVQFLKADIELPFGERPHPGICRYLIEEKISTEDVLDAAWNEAKAKKVEFVHYLKKYEIVSAEALTRGAAVELDLPFNDLAEIEKIPTHILRMIPDGVILRFKALPFKVEHDRLHVAFCDVHHMEGMTKLGLMMKMPIQPILAPQARLEELLTESIPGEAFKSIVANGEKSSGKKSTAVEMLTVLLRGLINAEGSDIHIEPSPDSARVRYRVDGVLHDFLTLDIEMAKRVSARLKVLANMEVDQRFLPQDGHLILQVDDVERNFRIATVPSLYGEKVAMRLVQNEMAFSNFEQLGMNQAQQELMNELINSSNGLVLTAGPVGSGKTTTLYSCLNCLDCFNQNIMTIEDPVEFVLSGVTQVEVHNKRGLTFGTGVRALLRQDVDTLMVGEIRDEETARIAVRASLSGTLVLSSIHANSATAACASMMQLGVSAFSVGNALAGIVFQNLARCICKDCREPYEADRAEKHELGFTKDETLTLYRGLGCASCFRTGFHGRTGVYEMIKMDENLRHAIFEQATHNELRAVARKAGMIPLSLQLRELVIDGTIPLGEMLRII